MALRERAPVAMSHHGGISHRVRLFPNSEAPQLLHVYDRGSLHVLSPGNKVPAYGRLRGGHEFLSSRRVASLAFTLNLGGCAAEMFDVRTPTFDNAVDCDEPRAMLHAQVDLGSGSACEERFALELYENAGIELVMWDSANGCRDRNVIVRYLPKRISKQALINQVTKLAVNGRFLGET